MCIAFTRIIRWSIDSITEFNIKYVDDKVAGAVTLWAGATTLANVQATYSAYPTGTRVAFWEERTYSRPANSNGGSVSISDRYRRVVKKLSGGTWTNAG